MKRTRKPKLEVLCNRTTVTRDHVALYEFVYVNPKNGEVDRTWHPVVSLDNGKVDCDCPHFNCRLFPQARLERVRPDIGSVKFQCKHIQRAVLHCIENGDIILNLQGASHGPTETHPGRHT